MRIVALKSPYRKNWQSNKKRGFFSIERLFFPHPAFLGNHRMDAILLAQRQKPPFSFHAGENFSGRARPIFVCGWCRADFSNGRVLYSDPNVGSVS